MEYTNEDLNRRAAAVCGYECRPSFGDEWYNAEGEFEGMETPDFCNDWNRAMELVKVAAENDARNLMNKGLWAILTSGQRVNYQPSHWYLSEVLLLPPRKVVEACLRALGLIEQETTK